MFDEYRASVLNTYKLKKKAGALTPNLMRSTPNKLREECLDVFNRKLLDEDLPAVSGFFGHKKDKTEYAQAIRKFDVDKFRPLDKFIKGHTAGTEDKNVELLAWLIGYEPRPFKYGHTYVIDGEDKSREKAVKVIRGDESEKKKKSWLTFAAIVIMVLLSGAGYLMLKRDKSPEIQHVAPSVINGQCMYWSGDRYTAVPCSEAHKDTPVVPLNSLKLNLLRKVTDISKINENSLGKVWYVRLRKDDYEYFTDSGFHPVDTQLRLKPITKFILARHILNRKN